MNSAHKMLEQDRQQQLLEVLVSPRHHALYQSSAAFNHQVSQLVRMLPLWIEFLAQQAQQGEEERQQVLKSLREETLRDVRFLG
jgi:hypothetical protein